LHFMVEGCQRRFFHRMADQTTRQMCWDGDQRAAVAAERQEFFDLMNTTMEAVATPANPLYGNKTYTRKSTNGALDWFGPRSLSVAAMHLFRRLRKAADLPDIPRDELSCAGYFVSDELGVHNIRDTRPVSVPVTVDPVESPAVSAHASVPGSSGSSGSSGGVTGSVGSGSVVDRSLSPTALAPRPVSGFVVGRGWSSTAVFPRVDQLTASPSPSNLVGGDASAICYGTPQRARAVRGVHLLASDILTPMNSQAEREAWAGLTDGHFDFDGRCVGDIFLSPE
jgi:hypothetical protein